MVVRGDSISEAMVQAMLSRGDHRLGRVLAEMPQPSVAAFPHALAQAGIDPDALLERIPDEAALPWDVVCAQELAR